MSDKKTPRIRFKGFEDDWEQRKFSDITYPSGEKNRDNLPYESYSITNESGFVPQDEKFENGGTMRDADKRMYYIVSPQSFAYNPARINVGSIGYQNTSKNVIVSSLYEIFKTTEEVDDRFLWHWFKSDDFQKLIFQLQEGGVRLYFYYDKLCMGSIALPSLAEQQRIGAYLDKLDHLIALHQRKLEKLKTIKKSMLENCFPKDGERVPKIRFSGFTGDWEQRKVQDVAFVSTGFPFDSKDFSDDGNFLVITNGNIQDASPVVDDSLGNRISIDDDKIKSAYLLNIGNILVTMDGTVGRTAKVIRNGQILAQRVGRLKAFNSGNFLYQWLNTGTFSKEMSALSHGGTIKHISLDEIRSYEAMMPQNSDEQEKIGKYFDNLDNLITLHQRKLEKLKQIKKSMLDSMFI